MIAKVSVHQRRLKELGLLDQGADIMQRDAPLSEQERKYCRCLVKVKSAVNPYAVCTKSVGRTGSVRCFQHYNLPRFDEEQLNALTKLHKKSSPDETVRVWLNQNAKEKVSRLKIPKTDQIPGLTITLQPYLLNPSNVSVCKVNWEKLLRQTVMQNRSDLHLLFVKKDIWDMVDFSINRSTLEITISLIKKNKSKFNKDDIEEVKAIYDNRFEILTPKKICPDSTSSPCCGQLDVDLKSINRI